MSTSPIDKGGEGPRGEGVTPLASNFTLIPIPTSAPPPSLYVGWSNNIFVQLVPKKRFKSRAQPSHTAQHPSMHISEFEKDREQREGTEKREETQKTDTKTENKEPI